MQNLYSDFNLMRKYNSLLNKNSSMNFLNSVFSLNQKENSTSDQFK